MFLDVSTGGGSSTIETLLLLPGGDSVTPITPRALLTNYNAVDFDALVDGNFLAEPPDGATQLTSGIYNNYLWLLKKTTAAGGSSEGAARQIEVFKLITVQESEDGPGVDLTYLQIVGEGTESATTTVLEDADDFVLDLSAIFDTVSSAVSSNPGLVTTSLSAKVVTLTFLADQNGTAVISVVATISSGDTVEASFSVTVTAVNDAPVFDPSLVTILAGRFPALIDEDQTNDEITVPPVLADDVDILTNGDSLVLTASSSDTSLVTATLSLSDTKLTLSYQADQNGTAIITLRATDSSGAFAEETFPITVSAVNDAPVFDTIAAQTVIDGEFSGSVQVTGIAPGPVTATDESGQAVTLTVAQHYGSTLSSLDINAATNIISYNLVGPIGTEATIRVTATDNGTPIETFEQDFTVTVVAAPLEITTTNSDLPGGTELNSYSETLVATGGTVPLIWTLIDGALPTPLVLGPTGLISGVLAVGTAGTHTFTVEVTDSASPQVTTQKELSITVVAAPLVIITTSLPDGQVGDATYSGTLVATGGTGTLTWTIKSSTFLPTGLNLDTATGLITGTPAVGTDGINTFTVEVTDSASTPVTTEKEFSITIIP